MNEPIFLLGFMGCGKSSTGKKLAKILHLNFIDLDREIEMHSQKTIAEIFEEKGEEYFRTLESNILRNQGGRGSSIIAVGGGTPCFNENMDYMNSVGKTVYLKSSSGRLLGRLRQGKKKRPLIANLNDSELSSIIKNLLSKRSEFYQKADIIFSIEDFSVEDLSLLLSSDIKSVK